MTTIERIRSYIDKTKMDNVRYDIMTSEMRAICLDTSGIFEAVSLAFRLGRAKGLREARAEARKEARKDERIAGFPE